LIHDTSPALLQGFTNGEQERKCVLDACPLFHDGMIDPIGLIVALRQHFSDAAQERLGRLHDVNLPGSKGRRNPAD